jgi:hypothetical protein
MAKKILIPAGLVADADLGEETLVVNATRAEIETAPAYEPIGLKLGDYKDAVARHFSRIAS